LRLAVAGLLAAALRVSVTQSEYKGENMRIKGKGISLIGLACVIGLLFTSAPVLAQEPEPIPTPIPIPIPVVGTVTNTYAAKFICGVQRDPSLFIVPDAQAGHYSTKINVHNNTGIPIKFRKKIIQLKGGQVPTPPKFRIFEELRPDWAMEVVCRDIYGHLGIPIPPQVDAFPPYIEGFVILEPYFAPLPTTGVPNDPLDVEGIYTYRAEPAGTDAVSINVVVFPVKNNRYTIPLITPIPVAGPVSGKK
jgi:hypothetical protein